MFSLPIRHILTPGQDPLASLFGAQGTPLASFFNAQGTLLASLFDAGSSIDFSCLP